MESEKGPPRAGMKLFWWLSIVSLLIIEAPLFVTACQWQIVRPMMGRRWMTQYGSVPQEARSSSIPEEKLSTQYCFLYGIKNNHAKTPKYPSGFMPNNAQFWNSNGLVSASIISVTDS